MIDPHLFLAFVVAVTILMLIPGPNVALIVANSVAEGTGTFGGSANAVHLVTMAGVESWPKMSKQEVAARLVERLASLLKEKG